MVFQSLSEPQGAPDPKKPLPGYLLKNNVALKAAGGDLLPVPGDLPLFPVSQLGDAALAVGHLNSRSDVDGAVRAEPLLIRYHDKHFPSLALITAATSLNLNVGDIKRFPGECVQLGKLRIGTDAELGMYTFVYGDR